MCSRDLTEALTHPKGSRETPSWTAGWFVPVRDPPADLRPLQGHDLRRVLVADKASPLRNIARGIIIKISTACHVLHFQG